MSGDVGVKQIVTELFDALGAGDWSNPDQMLRSMAEHGTWWVAGALPSSGTHTKAQMASRLPGVGRIAAGGLRIYPKSWIIEGNRAAVEAESRMQLRDGRVYNNHYHYAFEVADGKLVVIKEYLDTQYSKSMFADT